MTSLTLYQLQGEWLALANKLSDMDMDPQTIADTIEGSDVQMAIEEKVQGYEMVARNIESSCPVIQAEIKRLQALEKAVAARASALRLRVRTVMGDMAIQKISCPLFEIRIQKNPAALDVYDERMVPAEFWSKPDPFDVLDKDALKKALTAGREIQGARLTRGESLRIS